MAILIPILNCYQDIVVVYPAQSCSPNGEHCATQNARGHARRVECRRLVVGRRDGKVPCTIGAGLNGNDAAAAATVIACATQALRR